MPLADTHAHLSDPRFDPDRAAVLERARAGGVTLIVDVGADLDSSECAVAHAREVGGVHAAVGLHPHYAAAATAQTWQRLEQLAAEGAVVAIGETGLDFYRDLSPRPVQREAFDHHLALAERLGKPVLVHSRDAWDSVVDQLSGYRGRLRGVMHCFSGDEAMLAEALKLGFLVSLAGNVTYPKAHGLRQVARAAPAERLLLETDCPYLAPAPLRGRRNEPAHVALVARAVAEARDIEVERLSEITYGNAERLFGLA